MNRGSTSRFWKLHVELCELSGTTSSQFKKSCSFYANLVQNYEEIRTAPRSTRNSRMVFNS
jgi:hypothetical protein